MEEYKPNSHKSKEEQKNLVPEKRVEKVISGTVKSKKKFDHDVMIRTLRRVEGVRYIEEL